MKCLSVLRMRASQGVLVAVAIGLCLCKASLAASTPETTFRSEKIAEIDAAIEQTIANKGCPGAVLWIEHQGVSYHKAYGNRSLIPAVEPMREDTIFDLASLTKVVAGTPAVMLLIE